MGTSKKLLAVCVLTYRHPDTIRKVLPQWLLLLKELDFDLYYLDSSPEPETREIIEGYEQLCSRLHYVRVSPDYKGKGFLPYHKDFLPESYKYFWPIKDRSVPTPELMLRIYMNLINGCDAIEISQKHPNEVFAPLRYKSVYTDCAELYRDLAWSAIDIQCSIYNYDTVFSHYDEEMILERYPEPGFNHTMGFFHYLAEMDSCTIPFIYAGKKRCTILSTYTPSGWRLNNTGVELFGYNWPKTNEALPEVYSEYRDYAVKSETSLPALFGSVDGLLSLNFSDDSNRKYVEHMLTEWDKYSDLPVEVAQMIMKRDFDSVYRWFIDTLSGYLSSEQIDKASLLCSGTRLFLENTPFCNNSENKQIYDSLLKMYDDAE